MVLGDSRIIAFVATVDAERACHFFVEVLGLRLVDKSPYALVFDVQGTMLRVTTVEAVSPAPYTVLGWSVDDIAATVESLTQRSVVFRRYEGMGQDDRGIWTTPSGDRIAWFADPDGNVLSLTQRH